MFTGIVEDLGEVEAVEHGIDSARILVRSAKVTDGTRPGDSIAVNGVCLTVTSIITGRPTPAGTPPDPSAPPGAPRGFVADVMGETLARSSLKEAAPGTKVNLERSVRLEDRLGGHLVQGHVDATATILSRDPQENWQVVRISLPPGLARYVVHKGSITVDGVSLTVSGIAASPGGTAPPDPPGASPGGTAPPDPPGPEHWFEVSLIPETLGRTTLGSRRPGDTVNLEVDVIAKYVEKLLGGAR
jgi:riboflavin synthase